MTSFPVPLSLPCNGMDSGIDNAIDISPTPLPCNGINNNMLQSPLSPPPPPPSPQSPQSLQLPDLDTYYYPSDNILQEQESALQEQESASDNSDTLYNIGSLQLEFTHPQKMHANANAGYSSNVSSSSRASSSSNVSSTASYTSSSNKNKNTTASTPSEPQPLFDSIRDIVADYIRFQHSVKRCDDLLQFVTPLTKPETDSTSPMHGSYVFDSVDIGAIQIEKDIATTMLKKSLKQLNTLKGGPLGGFIDMMLVTELRIHHLDVAISQNLLLPKTAVYNHFVTRQRALMKLMQTYSDHSNKKTLTRKL